MQQLAYMDRIRSETHDKPDKLLATVEKTRQDVGSEKLANDLQLEEL
jgi:hypothetical protein